MYDQLGQHRVVKRRNRIPFGHTAIDADGAAGGRPAQDVQPAGGGQKALVRVFGVQARLDGMTMKRNVGLCQWQGFASGHAQLPFHQVQPGNHFRDRVFDLQAGVHLHEEEFARGGIDDEFHRAGPFVADRARCGAGCFAHGGTPGRVKPRCRGFFQYFLVAALYRAIAFMKMHALPVPVGKHLHFDMARPGQVTFEQDLVRTECRQCLPLAGSQCHGEILCALDNPHALAAAAQRGLDQDRKADATGFLRQKVRCLFAAVVAGYQRHTGGAHQLFGCGFAAHGSNRFGGRADKDQSGTLASAGKIRVFRQEAVTGVDGFGPAVAGDGQEAFGIQIAFAGRCRAEPPGFVGFADKQGTGIGIRIDGNGADTELAAGADDPAGDFATVGDQDLLEHGGPFLTCGTRRNGYPGWGHSGWPTGLAPGRHGFARDR